MDRLVLQDCQVLYYPLGLCWYATVRRLPFHNARLVVRGSGTVIVSCIWKAMKEHIVRILVSPQLVFLVLDWLLPFIGNNNKYFFDCPVLFFSGMRPGRTVGPIFTLYSSNDVFPRKEVPFGG